MLMLGMGERSWSHSEVKCEGFVLFMLFTSQNLNFLLSDRWKIDEIAFTWDLVLTSFSHLRAKHILTQSPRSILEFCLSSPSCSLLWNCCRHCAAKTAAILWSISFHSHTIFPFFSCSNVIRLPGRVSLITVVVESFSALPSSLFAHSMHYVMMIMSEWEHPKSKMPTRIIFPGNFNIILSHYEN